MNILVTGRGTSGSWEIRGEQLGEAIGATVRRDAHDVKGFDIAILVKRASPLLLQRLHHAKVPIIYDVVDSWPQPHGNLWDAATCKSWLAQQVAMVKPRALVASTKAMADDCAGFGIPVLTLPHHARPRQITNPIRYQVRRVGYEGGAQYLGSWQTFVEAQCAKRKWTFVINPSALSELDIVIAMREVTGYAARNWKSNVKLANAQGTGTPCVVNREAGYLETQSGGEVFADTHEEVGRALTALTSWEARKAAHTKLRIGAPTLDAVAKEYKEWLLQLN